MHQFSATLIFNPLSYALYQATSVRMVYVILSVLTLLIGLVTSATLRPLRESDVTESLAVTSHAKESSYESFGTEEKDERREKYTITVLWFITSLLKSMAYYTTYIMLVSVKTIFKKAGTQTKLVPQNFPRF